MPVNLTNLKVATKLWLFTFSLVLGLALVMIWGLLHSAGIVSDSRRAVQESSALVRAAGAWSALTEANLIRNKYLIMDAQPARLAELQAEINATSARISVLQKTIESAQLDDAARAQLQQIGRLRQAVLASRKAALQARLNGDPAQADRLASQDYLPLSVRYLDAQHAFVALQEQSQARIEADAAQRHTASLQAVGAILAVVAGAALACSVRLVRSIQQPLAEANHLAARIARGDLTASLQRRRGDEFGQLAASLQHMNDGLADMIRQVRFGADSIAQRTTLIAQGNQELSARTEAQASALQQSAASVEQLSATVRNNADQAQRANALAMSASALASKGGSAMQEAMAAMSTIRDSSLDIVNITGVIDSIAFQTNILALNAAVEAARAGEQGRGFAVVASEVRTLAQRAAGAAREIKQQVGRSVQQIEAGNQSAGEAGASIVAAVYEMSQLASMMSGIASATAEQSQGLQQINQAVAAMDSATQQNAALVEQAAAAARAMQERALQMAEMVRRFRLDGLEAAHELRTLTE